MTADIYTLVRHDILEE